MITDGCDLSVFTDIIILTIPAHLAVSWLKQVASQVLPQRPICSLSGQFTESDIYIRYYMIIIWYLYTNKQFLYRNIWRIVSSIISMTLEIASSSSLTVQKNYEIFVSVLTCVSSAVSSANALHRFRVSHVSFVASAGFSELRTFLFEEQKVDEWVNRPIQKISSSIKIAQTVSAQDVERRWLGFLQLGSQLRPQMARCSLSGQVSFRLAGGQFSSLTHPPVSPFLT